MRRRSSLRLPAYDYASVGSYFVTICTHDRRHVFGEIVDGAMRLNEMGRIVDRVWKELPVHYQNMECDEFVVMPNHVHAIIGLTDVPVGAGSTSVQISVGAGLKPAPTKMHGLPEIVRALKTFSARKINHLYGTPGLSVWQRNYYEHVIRGEVDLAEIRRYIIENPQKWALDGENTRCVNIG